MAVAGQAEGVLQLRAAGQHRPPGRERERQRVRHVAAGAAHRVLPAPEDPHHRVVGAGVDRAVVGERGVDDAGEPRARRLRRGRRSARRRRCRWSARTVAPAPRRAACAAACRAARGRATALPGATACATAAPARRGSRTIGRRGLVSTASAASSSAQSLRAGVQVGHQHRERLVLAVLARSQRRHGRRVRRIRRDVETAQALDREHRAGVEQRGRRDDRVACDGGAVRVEQPQRRPAGGAADRLRVEAAVGGVGVLGRAGRAHREARHRRRRTVVGDVGDDREPRPAVRAARERVPVAAVARVGDLGEAGGAGGGVGGDQRVPARGRPGSRRC